MKHKIIAVWAVILVVLVGGCSQKEEEPPTFPNEPAGVRGILWGASVFAVPGLKMIDRGDGFAVFVRAEEDLTAAGAQLEQIRYIFYKDQFYSAQYHFETQPNFAELLDELTFLYGEGDNRSDMWRDTFWWVGEFVNIRLDYSRLNQKGTLVYSYKPIYDQETADQIEASEEGTGEL